MIILNHETITIILVKPLPFHSRMQAQPGVLGIRSVRWYLVFFPKCGYKAFFSLNSWYSVERGVMLLLFFFGINLIAFLRYIGISGENKWGISIGIPQLPLAGPEDVRGSRSVRFSFSFLAIADDFGRTGSWKGHHSKGAAG